MPISDQNIGAKPNGMGSRSSGDRPIVNNISRKDIPDHPLAKGRVGHSLGFKKRLDPPGQVLIGVFGSRDVVDEIMTADEFAKYFSSPRSFDTQFFQRQGSARSWLPPQHIPLA
jgi:hypothetical protein